MAMDVSGSDAVPVVDTRPSLTASERFARLKLSLVNGVGPTLFHRLVEFFESAENVFRATLSQLGEVEKVGPQIASAIHSARSDGHVEKVMKHCDAHQVRILLSSDYEMPPLLRELPDCPAVLFVRGSFKSVDELSIGIVGHVMRRNMEDMLRSFLHVAWRDQD